MEELRDAIPKIKFLGYKCVKLNMQISEEYINSGTSHGMRFDMNYGGIKSPESENRFIENFEIILKDSSDEVFLNAHFIGIFESSFDIDEAFMNSPFIKANAPAILFPFIRAFVSTVTINGGLEPIILPTINFSIRAEIKSKE